MIYIEQNATNNIFVNVSEYKTGEFGANPNYLWRLQNAQGRNVISFYPKNSTSTYPSMYANKYDVFTFNTYKNQPQNFIYSVGTDTNIWLENENEYWLGIYEAPSGSTLLNPIGEKLLTQLAFIFVEEQNQFYTGNTALNQPNTIYYSNGNGVSPTPAITSSPTPTLTLTPTPTGTIGLTATPTPTNTGTPTNTPTQTESGTPTPTPTPTNTGTPTNTPTPTNTGTPNTTPTPTQTESGTPTPTPTPTNTGTPTNTPTPTNTETPTNTPTPTNTETPTNTPTPTNTGTPTNTPTNTGTPTPTPTPPIVWATLNGGTETTFVSGSTTWKVHTFNSTQSVSVVSPGLIRYVMVAGGGGAGFAESFVDASGGGGAGGYLESQLNITGTTHTITIGGGGADSTQGTNTSFFGLTAIGGGRGGIMYPPNFTATIGGNGGSGGGGTGNAGNFYPGGTGVAGQGFSGGTSSTGQRGPGGGGGASEPGDNGLFSGVGAIGGDGKESDINGTLTYRAGGGGAGQSNFTDWGAGGLGGGGRGGQTFNSGFSGVMNTGGGGGGAAKGNGGYIPGAAGGSGVVILAYQI
jgi:hypothetical protein